MQQNNINLDEITDIDKLKALAFDEIQSRDLAEINLKKIAARMQQVVAAQQTAADAAATPSPETPSAPVEPTDNASNGDDGSRSE